MRRRETNAVRDTIAFATDYPGLPSTLILQSFKSTISPDSYAGFAQLGAQGTGSNEGGGTVVGVVGAAGVEVPGLAGATVVVVSGGGCSG